MITVKLQYNGPASPYFSQFSPYIVVGWVTGDTDVAKAVIIDNTQKPRCVEVTDNNLWVWLNSDRVVTRQILEPFV